jgi:hypothetical protein
VLFPATAALAFEDAWFGSKRTPEKNPMVTIEAAAIVNLDGYCFGLSFVQREVQEGGLTFKANILIMIVEGRTIPRATWWNEAST